MKKNIKTLFYIVLYSVLVSGCTKNHSSVSMSELFDYSIDQSISCFYLPRDESVKLFIAADTIADAVWLSNNAHLSYSERRHYRTIKGLFAEIERCDSSSSFQVSVAYDSVNNLPSRVSIYPKPVIVNDSIIGITLDANISYTTWNYTKYK